MSTSNTLAVAPASKNTVKGWIESDAFRAQVARALPKHLTPDRFLRVALTATLRTPKLLNCTPESVTQCLLQCSQFGLEPDGRRAHLIPFEDRKNNTTVCTLILDYKGLVELAMRSGLVSHLHADVVRSGDVFEYNLGEIKTHVPWFLRRDADKPESAGEDVAVYAFARMRDGASAVAVMSVDEVLSIRDNSQGWKAFKSGYTKQCPWDPENWVSEQEMKKKTALRRLTKMLPLSPEFRDAVDVDDEPQDTAVDVTPPRPIFKTEPVAQIAPAKAPEPQPEPVAPVEPPAAPEPVVTPQAQLASIIVGAGFTFDQFVKVVKEAGHLDAGAEPGSFDELPEAVAARLVRTQRGLLNLLKVANAK